MSIKSVLEGLKKCNCDDHLAAAHSAILAEFERMIDECNTSKFTFDKKEFIYLDDIKSKLREGER